MKAILNPCPELDFFFGILGGPLIPTKQDKFKPIMSKDIFVKEGTGYVKIQEEELYLKKKGKDSKRGCCWEAHHIAAGDPDTLSNREILCCDCHKRMGYYGRSSIIPH